MNLIYNLSLNANMLLSSQNNGGIKEELKDKFRALFPTWPMFLATIIAFVLVVLILWFLLHKPIKRAMKERHDYIQKNIDEAKLTNDISKQKLNEANKRLAEAYSEADELIKNAKIHGENVIEEYVHKARNESKRIIDKAHTEIESERQKMINDSKSNIAKAAIEISKKIMQKEVTKESQDEVINNFLKDN
ncbi:F0F1 ATP synthase subunit B [Mycoplasma bovis]|uniref:F0F1 ATP synthase subunit B n=1 Tax=Mycoplasmopsis bovis TaxID=28903 RepID=UPI001BDF027D|nr:F0F1 ATP synthase subunit B [Mycoplasmopsis bovis]MBT1318790.1 F0F1 ATP synthase subunit B [Mycoplasmopsis bovis]MBT1323187.1 F0F1 ATP synthase subunit B [Mycoplasmopsis bovis]MBT1324843.1 F0F1 ATP synthase subunit B [Mycoplasmopsis bovis]MBT1325520.1 F0F1 ATP synthase subunit B [Mycoplasmopsis bovis]MBT1328551.1 F0F1 ATP synthase subunit B [Mycoplasmopsis bovis]